MVVNIIVWLPEESANNKAFQHANSWTTGQQGFPVVQFECKIIKK